MSSGAAQPPAAGRRPGRWRRNDPALYDDLAGSWQDPVGPLAPLQWLAAARARLLPPAAQPQVSLLVDLGCGGGGFAPHAQALGYRHVGVDLVSSALRVARDRGMAGAVADVAALPLPDRCADVVCAGEILEHVTDLPAVVAQACRILRPGGLLVVDTLAATALSRLLAIHLAERLPRVPSGVHDPALLVDRVALRRLCAAHGVSLTMRGLRPTAGSLLRWWTGRAGRPGAPAGAMVPTWSTAVLVQAWGVKR
ncbi:MAG: methyltransferase domain-containing protein [Actinomycetota bacterium]|nr:MAG: methyltransferase domain-containing protein [Actinomycetota bacterium]